MTLRRLLTTRFEFKVRNPWAVLLQGLALVFFISLASVGIIFARTDGPARWILVGVCFLAAAHVVLQMRLTWQAGKWYGALWPSLAYAFFLPRLIFAQQTYAGETWLQASLYVIFYGIMTIGAIWTSIFDLFLWPREARERGIALDQSAA